MKLLGSTMSGHSQYDDRLWGLLGDYADLDPTYPHEPSHPIFGGIDHIGLIPYLLLAGASVRTQVLPGDDGMVNLMIEVPDEFEDEFYRRLEGLLQKGRAAAE